MRFVGRREIGGGGHGGPEIPGSGTRRPLRRLGRAVRRAAKCRRGANLIEFSLLVPMLIPILMGAIEVTWQFCTSVALDKAAFEAARFGSLGRSNPDGTRNGPACEAAIKAEAVKAAGGFLSASRLTLTPTQYASSSGVGAGPSGGTRGTGVGGSFVAYTLAYEQPLLFVPKIASSKGGYVLIDRSFYNHSAATIVMNEPYPDATNTTPC